MYFTRIRDEYRPKDLFYEGNQLKKSERNYHLGKWYKLITQFFHQELSNYEAFRQKHSISH
jgi:hypothetical protein